MNKFVISKDDPEIQEVLSKINTRGFLPHNVEQIIFRINNCIKCLQAKKCKNCNCNPLDKIVEPITCNKVSPNIMSKEKWEKFKTEHNIEIL